jgi:hypothetical protein
MSISKKLLSVITAVLMVATMMFAIPATASAAGTVRINEVNAQVGQQVLYDFYVQTGSQVNNLEGRLNYDGGVLSLRSIQYNIDADMTNSTTVEDGITTISFKGSKSLYDTASSRVTVLTAVFDVTATSTKYTSTTTDDAVSACFTKLTSTSGEDLMKSDSTNITTRTIIAPTSVTMAKTSVTLVGKNDKETVNVKAVGPVNNDVESSYLCTYKSSNTKVAKVSGRSTRVTITAVGPGVCYITCTPDGGLTSTKIKVTVKQPVTKITLNKSKVSLAKKNASAYVQAKVTPTNASNKNIAVTNSNKKVVKISASTIKSGAKLKVTALKKGSATLTFKAKDGSNKSAKCTVTVKK